MAISRDAAALTRPRRPRNRQSPSCNTPGSRDCPANAHPPRFVTPSATPRWPAGDMMNTPRSDKHHVLRFRAGISAAVTSETK